MTQGWRNRIARIDTFSALLFYQYEDGRIEYVDEPPAVIEISDELLRVWGCPEDGVVRVHTTRGTLAYDIVGADPFRNSWVAVRMQDE